MSPFFRQAIRRLTTSAIQRQPQHDGGKGTKGPFNILFCGTDEFALECFKKVYERKHLFQSIQVLTPSDHQNDWNRRKGKFKRVLDVSPVKEFAISNKVPNYQVPAETSETSETEKVGGGLLSWFENELPLEFQQKQDQSNLLLTCSFGHLIPPVMLDHFDPMKRLNVHPSLLPALKGAAPIQWAIARGLQKTGISIQTLKTKFDSGDILAQTEIQIPKNVMYSDLYKILKPIAADLLVDTLENLEERSQHAWSQKIPKNGMIASRAPILQAKNAEIKWNDWTAEQVEARHRGIGYIYPLTTLTTTRSSGKKLVHSNIIFRNVELYDVQEERRKPSSSTEIVSDQALQMLKSAMPGTAFVDKKSGLVLCRCANDPSAAENKDVFLRLIDVQTVGRNIMTAQEWANGYTIETKGAVRQINFTRGLS